MNTLPAIPQALSIDKIALVETQVAERIGLIDDIEQLAEWRAQAAALATYLQSRELRAPMLGAQRRVEARIGQLFGECPGHGPGRGHTEKNYHGKPFNDRQIHEFRVLARGFGHLSDEEWRHSRDELLKLINEKFPMEPKRPQVVIQKDGTVKKRRAERIKEISRLAGEGYRAAQIAKMLSIGERRVRAIANEASIVLPDAAIGRPQKPDAKRVLTETINGIDAYVSGLSMLDDLGFPELDAQERRELMQALSRAINGLRKLRIKMAGRYARPNTTAA